MAEVVKLRKGYGAYSAGTALRVLEHRGSMVLVETVAEVSKMRHEQFVDNDGVRHSKTVYAGTHRPKFEVPLTHITDIVRFQ
jgi:hypothetical protein